MGRLRRHKWIQPSGVSSNPLSRTDNSGGRRSSHESSSKPTSIMSRKCVRSLSRKEVSFIRTSDSKFNTLNACGRSTSDKFGAGATYSLRTFSPAKTRCTASRGLPFGPSKNMSIPAACRCTNPAAANAIFTCSKSARATSKSTSTVLRPPLDRPVTPRRQPHFPR